jgi:hypothetical protein
LWQNAPLQSPGLGPVSLLRQVRGAGHSSHTLLL